MNRGLQISSGSRLGGLGAFDIRGGGGNTAPNPLIAGVTCPAITPTLGSELVTNGGFEGTYVNRATNVDIAPNWSNSGLIGGTDAAAAETTTIHGGSESQKVVATANNRGVSFDSNIFIQGTWNLLSCWANITSGGVTVFDSSGGFVRTQSSTTGAWENLIATGYIGAGGNRSLVSRSVNASTFYLDDCSVLAITQASMFASVGTWAGRDGTYACHPTVAAYTQAGMAIAYLNATNFVLAMVYRVAAVGDMAKLWKYINGTWTEVITGAITYGATKELKVVVSGTSYSLYYNNVQVGTTQTISDTLGTGVYGFNSYAGNTVGVVTANP